VCELALGKRIRSRRDQFGRALALAWKATSADGQTWFPARTLIGLRIGDPGAVAVKDASLLVIGTGPPHAGTRSAQRPKSASPAERQPQ